MSARCQFAKNNDTQSTVCAHPRHNTELYVYCFCTVHSVYLKINVEVLGI